MKSDDEIIDTLRTLSSGPSNAAEIARVAMEGGRAKKSSRPLYLAGACAACAALALVLLAPAILRQLQEPTGAQMRGSLDESLPQLVIYAGKSADALSENPSPSLQDQVSAEVVFSTRKNKSDNNFAVYLKDQDALLSLQSCTPIPAEPQSVKLSQAFELQSQKSQLVVALFEQECSAELVRDALVNEENAPGVRLRVRSFLGVQE